MGVNNPYFDKIRFKVNRSTVKLISELQTHRSSTGIGQFLLSNNDFDPTYNPEFRQYQMMCDEIADIVQKGQNPQTSFQVPEEILEKERQMAFGDKVMAEEDMKKKLALYDEEYARVKDDPALEEYAAFIAKQRKAVQYAAMTPEEQAAKMAELMQQKQKDMMTEAGYSEEDIEKTLAVKTSEEEKDDSPKLGDPGVCPDCGATDQTGKFCEYCGAKVN